jgi:hypothetical protein
MAAIPLTIQASTIDRCKSLIAEINESAIQWDAFRDQICWKGLGGAPIYRDGFLTNDFNESFFENLRRERQIFSGEPLEQELICLPPIPAWLALRFHRQIYKICSRKSLDWGAYEFARVAAVLPRKFRCKLPIDNGGVKISGYLANRETAAYQERIFLMHKAGILQRLGVLEKPVALEVGAGFGALAYCVKTIIPHARYILVDLPSSLIHAGCWLTQWMPQFRISVYREGTLPDSDFVLVPHTAVKSLACTIDFAINTLSFGEMTEATVRDYGLFIKDKLTSDGALFEQNFDNTNQGIDTFCNPAKILDQIFSNREIISQDSWRGVASIWS